MVADAKKKKKTFADIIDEDDITFKSSSVASSMVLDSDRKWFEDFKKQQRGNIVAKPDELQQEIHLESSSELSEKS